MRHHPGFPLLGYEDPPQALANVSAERDNLGGPAPDVCRALAKDARPIAHSDALALVGNDLSAAADVTVFSPCTRHAVSGVPPYNEFRRRTSHKKSRMA